MHVHAVFDSDVCYYMLLYHFEMGLRGFHYYMQYWEPTVGQPLHFLQETDNKHDCCAVAATLIGTEEIVCNVPLEISRYFFADSTWL